MGFLGFLIWEGIRERLSSLRRWSGDNRGAGDLEGRLQDRRISTRAGTDGRFEIPGRDRAPTVGSVVRGPGPAQAGTVDKRSLASGARRAVGHGVLMYV